MSVNKVILLGNIASDIDAKEVGGNKVVSFRMAMNEKYTDRNNQVQEKVEYVSVTAWRRNAEVIAQYCTKGKKLYVEGKLQTRAVEKNGETRYYTEVLADRVEFCFPPSQPSAQQAPSQSAPQAPANLYAPHDDDLPF